MPSPGSGSGWRGRGSGAERPRDPARARSPATADAGAPTARDRRAAVADTRGVAHPPGGQGSRCHGSTSRRHRSGGSLPGEPGRRRGARTASPTIPVPQAGAGPVARLAGCRRPCARRHEAPRANRCRDHGRSGGARAATRTGGDEGAPRRREATSSSPSTWGQDVRASRRPPPHARTCGSPHRGEGAQGGAGLPEKTRVAAGPARKGSHMVRQASDRARPTI